MQTFAKSVVLAAALLLLASGSALARDEALPAAQVIAAIQLAVAEAPGLVKDVEVDREHGKLIVKVEIVDVDGRKIKVRVDPESNTRVR